MDQTPPIDVAADQLAQTPCPPEQVTTPRDQTGDPPILSLCMIVRDAAKTLPACLQSVRPWVDEMVVVDTGSVDDTVSVASSMGARVLHFPWCDDFASARNVSLGHARGRWLFWMDADDTIDEENGRRLKELSRAGCADDVLGYVMQVHCPGNEAAGSSTTVVDHIKMVRNVPYIGFEGRIHEQVLPSIRRLGGDVGWTDVFVVHSGTDRSPEGRRRKYERDLRLLRLELAERPGNSFALFNLGMTLADAGDHATALEALYRSREAAEDGESHLRKVFALLAACEADTGRHRRAWDVCAAGLTLFPDDEELLFRRAMLEQQFGRTHDAVRTYRHLLQAPRGRHFSSIDSGIIGYKARHNLASALQDLGELAAARAQYELATRSNPHFRPSWQGLMEVTIALGDLPGADGFLCRMRGVTGLTAEVPIQEAAIALARGDERAARSILEEAAAAASGDDVWLLRARCKLLFDRGTPEEAQAVLSELIDREPSDASALHNLGTVRLRQGRAADAADLYRRALTVRPRYAPTLQLLNRAEELLAAASAPPAVGAGAEEVA